MNDALYKATVLVLNRNWQAIDVKTPAQAFCMMANGNATGLDIQGIGDMRPVRWNEWLELAVREDDNAVRTVRGLVRIPTVLVLARYNKVPKRRPKLSTKGIWERDGGRCQYTGKKLVPAEGNIDHVVPRSRGGQTSWENCVLADKRVVAVGTIPELLALDHPWIQEYFNGPRGRAAEDSAGRDAAHKSAIGPATGSGDDGGMTD